MNLEKQSAVKAITPHFILTGEKYSLFSHLCLQGNYEFVLPTHWSTLLEQKMYLCPYIQFQKNQHLIIHNLYSAS